MTKRNAWNGRTGTVLVSLLLSCVPISLILCRYPQSARTRYYISQIIDCPPISASLVPLNTAESVDFLQFTSPDVGWLGSHGAELYRTTDAGNTWESINLDVPGYVAQMRFVSDRAGWMIVDQSIREGGITREVFGKLLHTEDAGKTWTTELDLKGTHFVDLSVNGNEVWVLGEKSGHGRQLLASGFVLLHSKDNGEEWTDSFAQLNRLTMSIDSIRYDRPAALLALPPHTLILLTGNAVILRSSDDGENWSRIANLDTFGVPADKLIAHTPFPLVLAGMGGNHGTVSWLGTLAADGTLTLNVLGEVYITDVLSIPDRGILAVGSRVVVETNPRRVRREGVILFSTDLGRNWITIHRATQVEKITSVELNGDTICAGGPRGYLVKLPANTLPD